VNVRLRLVDDGRAPRQPAEASRAKGARIRVERRAVTVSACDGRGEAFARTLAEELCAHGVAAVLVAAVTGRESGGADVGLADALARPDGVAVVSDPVLAAELSGVLDVWIGPLPASSAAEVERAAARACQLELRTSPLPVARLLAAHLAGQFGVLTR
jgi:hypothetical protein